MRNLRSLQSASQVVIGGVVLVLLLRTWVVLGLVLPVQVTGNSMAPALLGEHFSIHCPNCEKQIHFAAEFGPTGNLISCPHCGGQSISPADMPIQAGDSLVINRFSGSFRRPRRGELVVVHNPTAPRQLCVKRVLGMPGESLQLRWGDVWVNGQPATKSLLEQRALRQPIHQETAEHQRWHLDSAAQWHKKNAHWEIDTRGHTEPQWLRYHHPADRPITDEYTYNAGLTRQLNFVRDMMISARTKASGDGTLLLVIEANQQECCLALSPKTAKLTMELDGAVVAESQLPRKLVSRFASDEVLVEFSNFDGQILLAIEGEPQLAYRWIPQTAPSGIAQPVSIGASNLRVTLRELCLYRDIFYDRQAVGLAPESENLVVRLQPGQYYLLGDNSPISIDSRSWGPVPEGFFVGQPLAPGF